MLPYEQKTTSFVNPYTLKEIKSIRSSVILYTIINNNIWFLLGIDKKTGEITDLGGGIKKHENNLVAGYREFNEETNGIFKDVTNSINLDNTVALINYKQRHGVDSNMKKYLMSVLFIPVDGSFTIKSRQFKNEVNNNGDACNDEIKDLVWIKDVEFIDLINRTHCRYNLWSRIANFYNKHILGQLFSRLKVKAF